MNVFIRRPAMWGLTAAFAVVLMSVAQSCFAQHYDVLVTSESGALQVGGYDDDTNTGTFPGGEQLRVFEGEVVPDIVPSNPYISEAPGEPGIRAMSQAFLDSGAMSPSMVYTALAPSTNLTFNFQPFTVGANTRNLFFWDGSGAVDFAPVSSSVVLGLTKFGGGGWTESIDGADNSVIAGNIIQESTSTGTVHTHLFTSIGNSGGPPAQGFYLYSLQLEMAGFTSSDPLYFVYGALDPGNVQLPFTGNNTERLAAFEVAHGEAAAWVEANLVPEPSTYALMGGLAVAAIPLVRRFRRRR